MYIALANKTQVLNLSSSTPNSPVVLTYFGFSLGIESLDAGCSISLYEASLNSNVIQKTDSKGQVIGIVIEDSNPLNWNLVTTLNSTSAIHQLNRPLPQLYRAVFNGVGKSTVVMKPVRQGEYPTADANASGGGGGSSTNLGIFQPDPNTVEITSSTGSSATLPNAGPTSTGILNKTDWSTFNSKQDSLGFTPENSANKGVSGGYPGLDNNSKIPSSNLPSGSLTEDVSGILTINGPNTLLADTTIQVKKSSTLQDGYLAKEDWGTFNSKQDSIALGTVGQYYRGDKTFQDLNSTAVGLGNVSDDAQLKRDAGDFATFPVKAIPTVQDIILIEDASNADSKSFVTLESLPISEATQNALDVKLNNDIANLQAQLGTPSVNPEPGTLDLYAKVDDGLYILNSAGIEKKLAVDEGPGSWNFFQIGSQNLISNQDISQLTSVRGTSDITTDGTLVTFPVGKTFDAFISLSTTDTNVKDTYLVSLNDPNNLPIGINAGLSIGGGSFSNFVTRIEGGSAAVQAKLTPSLLKRVFSPAAQIFDNTFGAYERFGYDVSISGDGSTMFSSSIRPNVYGVVYAYKYNNALNQWAQTNALLRPGSSSPISGNGNDHNSFGLSTSLSYDGTIAVVGAPNILIDTLTANSTSLGNVYIYNFDGTNWTLKTTITGTVPGFGFNVKISDDGTFILVSSILENGNTGNLYAYSYDNTMGIASSQPITLPTLNQNTYLGYSISVASNGTSFIATTNLNQVSNSNFLYLFTYNGIAWEATQLPAIPSNISIQSCYASLSKDASTIAVSFPLQTSGSNLFIYNNAGGLGYQLAQSLSAGGKTRVVLNQDGSTLIASSYTSDPDQRVSVYQSTNQWNSYLFSYLIFYSALPTSPATRLPIAVSNDAFRVILGSYNETRGSLVLAGFTYVFENISLSAPNPLQTTAQTDGIITSYLYVREVLNTHTVAGGSGGLGTDLGLGGATATSLQITSSTGLSVDLPAATSSTAGILTAPQYNEFTNKIDAIPAATTNNICFFDSTGKIQDLGLSVNNINPFVSPSSVQIADTTSIVNYLTTTLSSAPVDGGTF